MGISVINHREKIYERMIRKSVREGTDLELGEEEPGYRETGGHLR